MAVDIPKFHNAVTNLLAPHAALRREPKPRKGPKGGAAEGPEGPEGAADGEVAAATAAAPAPGATQQQGAAAAAAAAAARFIPATKFGGQRPGMAFKLGPQGLGYYPDGGGAPAAVAAAGGGEEGQPGRWWRDGMGATGM